MMSLKIQGINKLSSKFKKVGTKLNNVPNDAYVFFVNQTPVRSGNARRNTKLQNKTQIQANYPYAKRLDEGYSKQSPKGMINPTIDFIRNRVKEILAGK